LLIVQELNVTRILVVDDEKDLADYLADELKIEGYETGIAYDGVEAIIKIIDFNWDVLLMDIRMPKLNGINALRIIHRIKPDLPVIMFTGQAGQAEMLEATHLGAYTCLLKPVSTDNLFRTIKQVL
jgi:two-component system, OmpR family, response regulator VicR